MGVECVMEEQGVLKSGRGYYGGIGSVMEG